MLCVVYVWLCQLKYMQGSVKSFLRYVSILYALFLKYVWSLYL